MSDGLKRCKRCGTEWPVRAFSPKKGSRDGLQSYCKRCAVAYARQRKKDKQRGVRTNLVTVGAVLQMRVICPHCGTDIQAVIRKDPSLDGVEVRVKGFERMMDSMMERLRLSLRPVGEPRKDPNTRDADMNPMDVVPDFPVDG